MCSNQVRERPALKIKGKPFAKLYVLILLPIILIIINLWVHIAFGIGISPVLGKDSPRLITVFYKLKIKDMHFHMVTHTLNWVVTSFHKKTSEQKWNFRNYGLVGNNCAAEGQGKEVKHVPMIIFSYLLIANIYWALNMCQAVLLFVCNLCSSPGSFWGSYEY